MAEKTMKYENVYTEGISKITNADFKYAAKMGRTIKLFGLSREEDGKYFAMVAPFLIPKTHPMAMVNGVFNAIFVHGNMLDDSMYYGRGAGSLPTASAVVSDVIDCARHIGKIIKCFWDEEEVDMKDVKDAEFKYFVRCEDTKHEEALELFEQVSLIDAGVSGEMGFVTGLMKESDFDEKAAKLGIISRIRLMD